MNGKLRLLYERDDKVIVEAEVLLFGTPLEELPTEDLYEFLQTSCENLSEEMLDAIDELE